MAPTPGIEPGPTGWQLETIPQRHSDIYLKWPELKLFNRLHLFLKSKNKNQAQFRNNLDVQVTGAVTKTSNNNANIPKGISVTPSGNNNSTKDTSAEHSTKWRFRGTHICHAPMPGIEPGPAGWQLKTIPRRHSDIYLQRHELHLFIPNRCHLRRNNEKLINNAHNYIMDRNAIYFIYMTTRTIK